MAHEITDQLVKVAAWIRSHQELVRDRVQDRGGYCRGRSVAIMGFGYVIMGVGKAFGIVAGYNQRHGHLFQTLGGDRLGVPTDSIAGGRLDRPGWIYRLRLRRRWQGAPWLGERFKDLKEDVLEAWRGISDALGG